jgi:hypothetical protein
MVNDNGKVILTATAPTATLDIPWLLSSGCNAPELGLELFCLVIAKSSPEKS